VVSYQSLYLEERMSRLKIWFAVAAGVGLAAYGAWLLPDRSHAADHLDPPARTDPANMGTDRNADIADVFAWYTGTGANAKLVSAMGFSGPNPAAAGQKMPCDRDVLYTLYIQPGPAGEPGDETKPRIEITVRLGKDSVGNCFATFQGLPNVNQPVRIRTETPATVAGFNLFVGLRDDPFFFDLDGFRETLRMGSIRMISDRDFFARKNTPVMVVEQPLPTGQEIKIWGTTARIK
jgi:hypothetical protein